MALPNKNTIPLSELLYDMLEREASDLYLSVDAMPHFSLHGDFIPVGDAPLSASDTAIYAQEILTSEQFEEFQREMEINVSYTLGENGRFRVNVFTQRDSISLVIRRINTEIPSLKQLDLPDALGKLVLQERGLILMTGATGSGKSTTLAAMIDYRNDNLGGHIVTIEDPVEFVHRNKRCIINQREVGVDTKSFKIALKNTLRQAPKIIYIGEIRDQETMEFAIHAAETGHLVLGTLHSNNANQTLERIMNFFPNSYHKELLLQLSMNLRAVISQRLIKRARGGRVAALEILINTPYISELITQGEISAIKAAMGKSRAEGCQTFDQHLQELWQQQVIAPDEALRNADSANNLRLAMKGIAVG